MSVPEVITFGCRLNSYESEIMQRNALAAGLEDTVIVNTCAVTVEAERQAKQSIRRLRRERPGARIIVTGCAAQISRATFSAMPEVDHIVENGRKTELAAFNGLTLSPDPAAGVPPPLRGRIENLSELRESGANLDFLGEGSVSIDPSPAKTKGLLKQTQVFASSPARGEERAPQAQRPNEIQRAFVQVQNGCDHRCTFCIIPYGRGASRSMTAAAIAEETRARVNEGYREIVFTGVDIASYGGDLPGKPKLGRMIREVLDAVPELPWLRLSSIDPAAIDDDLWELIAEEPRLLPHLHLSVQAGDDLILKRMKRRHLRNDVIKLCRRARDLRPDIAFGADFIAGFPTETEAMFQNTLDLAEECGIAWLHVFPYSARSGTPAAKMPQINGALRRERAERLRALGERAAARHMKNLVGQQFDVLVEQQGLGCTRQFAKVKVEGEAPVGEIVAVECVGCEDGRAVVKPV